MFVDSVLFFHALISKLPYQQRHARSHISLVYLETFNIEVQKHGNAMCKYTRTTSPGIHSFPVFSKHAVLTSNSYHLYIIVSSNVCHSFDRLIHWKQSTAMSCFDLYYCIYYCV